MTILRTALVSMQEFLAENSDGPTSGMLFMSSPVPTLSVILIYLVIVKVSFSLQRTKRWSFTIYLQLLPKVSRNPKPATLRKMLAVYDVILVLGYSSILISLMWSDWMTNFHVYCRTGIPEESKHNSRVSRSILIRISKMTVHDIYRCSPFVGTFSFWNF